MIVELIKEFHFEAAHRNSSVSEDDPRSRLHGHSYRVEIVVAGPVNNTTGWYVDYADIKAAFRPYLKQLDHAYLNEINGIGEARLPDIERWIAARAGSSIPGFQRAIVSIPMLENFGVHFVDNQLCVVFGAAHRLPNVPEGHPCGRLHGHTYRIAIPDPPPAAIEIVRELHTRLAYSDLNTISGLENPTSENLAAWLWEKCADHNITPSQITISETCTARCNYRGI